MNKDKENLLNRWQKFDFYFYALKNGLNWKELHSEKVRAKLKEEYNNAESQSKGGPSQVQTKCSKAAGTSQCQTKNQAAANGNRNDDELELSHNIAAYLSYLRDKDLKNDYAVDPLSRWLNALQKIRMLKHDYRNEWFHAFSNALEIKMNQIGENHRYYRVYELMRTLLYGNDIPILDDCDEFTINILADLMQELSDAVNDPQVLEQLLSQSNVEAQPEAEPREEEGANQESPNNGDDMVKLLERLNSLPLFRNLKNFLDPFNMDPEVRKELEKVLTKISEKLEL